MTLDTRTPAEIAYDATRLSRTPADQGPFGTDVTDEMIAIFERLEAAHPEETAEQILVRARPFDIDACVAEVERRLNDPAREPFVVRTHPLAPEQIENTRRIFQLLEENHQERLLRIFEQAVCLPEPEQSRAFDAMLIAFEVVEEIDDEPADTPLRTLSDGSRIDGTFEEDGSHSCVHLVSADGQFYADRDGTFSGDWAGFYFEELTLEQAAKLRNLFSGPLLLQLFDAAQEWCKK